METSTVDLLLNVGRAIGSGWELYIQSDGTFGLCASDIGAIVFGVDSLRGIFRPVSWSIVANESSEAFAYCYNGIRAAFFKLLTPCEAFLRQGRSYAGALLRPCRGSHHSCRKAYWNYSNQHGGSFVSSAPAGTW